MITKDFDSWVPFIGTVEDVNDPKMLGRVRIRVMNHHGAEVNTGDLDWATPIIPNSAAVQGAGSAPVGLAVGSMVVGFYIDGKSRAMPLIMGSFAKIPGGDDSKHDVHERARGKNTIRDKQVGPEPASAFGAEYPHNKVFATASGHLIEIDDTPGKERINIRHKSGSYAEINNEGRIVLKAADDQFIITDGDSHSYTDKDATYEAKGKMVIKAKGKFSISSDGPIQVFSKSKISLAAPVVDLMGS